MKLAGKITPKALGWDRSTIGEAVKKVPADGGKVLLGRFGGRIAGLKQTVNNETGDIQSGLKGNFRGISSRNDADGNPIRVDAGVLYLPGGIQESFEGELASAQDPTNGGNPRATVDFLIDLYAYPETNKAGYSFFAEPIVQPQSSENDPVSALFKLGEQAQLEAPKPEAEAPAKEEAPATEKKGK